MRCKKHLITQQKLTADRKQVFKSSFQDLHKHYIVASQMQLRTFRDASIQQSE